MEHYDLIVIGAGPGGYVAAIRAAQLGKKTALVEKRATLGGTCLNVGCIPSKALLETSELYHTMQHKLGDHGLNASDIAIDVKKMIGRKDKIVSELVGGISMLMKKNKVDVIQGKARFKDAQTIVVENEGEEQDVQGDIFIVATGSESVELPFMPFNQKTIISSTEALALDEVPKHLIVVGAGAIGLEMGSVWSRLGAKVSVVELASSILPFADAEMSKSLQRSLKKQGLEFILGAKVTGAKDHSEGVELLYEDKKGTQSLVGDRVLVAVGRRPFTDGLGLEDIGVKVERGRVIVNEKLKTHVDNIYAIGDIVAGPMLAHKAEEEGIAAVETICGKSGHVNYDVIPNIVYTWPELAQVGMSEEEATKQGFKFKTGKFRFIANGRAKTMGETEGLCKIVSEEESDRILGAHIVGPRASDMIAELVMAMEFSASSEDVARSCHAHPTLAEVVKEAALAVDGRAIHG